MKLKLLIIFVCLAWIPGDQSYESRIKKSFCFLPGIYWIFQIYKYFRNCLIEYQSFVTPL